MSWILDAADLRPLATGASVLGSGGAGDPWLFELLAREVLATYGPVTVYDHADLPDEGMLISTGLVGSVTAFTEKPSNGYECTRAFTRLRDALTPTRPVYVCGYETAGVNAFLPLIVAAQTQTPLVDVDCMGRGLSWLDQTTYDAVGIPIAPFTLSDSRGHTITAEAITGHEAERYIRTLTVTMGGWSAFAGYPVDTAAAGAAGVHGALARALGLGRSLDAEPSRHLGSGRVSEVTWQPGVEAAHGSVVVWLGPPDNRPLRIETRNEFLMVLDRGQIVATAPDIICLLDQRTRTPLLTETVAAGYQVDVLVYPAPSRWTEPAFSHLASPAAFGYSWAQS
ncbi:DUF917 domain-containing protein [Streptomyces sp. NPDC059176]|uniref:DUF917 domain-containing protein n=1 Tax=unclassified Streptomyces TaxID=2593676 RepID=UPI00368553EE